MHDGRIVQTGSPTELYDDPVNHYVADFVGKSNFFEGKVVEADGQGARIETAAGRVFAGRNPKKAASLLKGAAAVLAVRPEIIFISSPKGEHPYDAVEAEGLGEVLVRAPKHAETQTGGFSPGDQVLIGWHSAAALALEDS
jgi:spermidine/putrescine transport system ATP-binding protein